MHIQTNQTCNEANNCKHGLPTVNDCTLQGCSGQQEHDTAPLLHMARLLNVMKAQGVASTRSAARQPLEESLQEPSDAAAYSGKLVQLLTAATAQWSKLISDTTQLFPSDMNDALKAYRWVVPLPSLNLSSPTVTLLLRLPEQHVLQVALLHNIIYSVGGRATNTVPGRSALLSVINCCDVPPAS